MLLFAIKEYIKKNPRTSIIELSNKFHIDCDHLRVMLERWMNKNNLSRFMPENNCNSGSCSCSSCVILGLELYTWNN